jgi:hypothetical protein
VRLDRLLVERLGNRLARVRQHPWRMRADVSREPHVVIGGSPRSGTTLLRRLLDEHPAFAGGPESSLFLPARIDVARLAHGYGIPGPELAHLLRDSTSQTAFIDAFAARYLAARGRRRWVEKTPLNIHHLAWIRAHFPEAPIIHLVRDGRDVVCSMRQHPDRRWVDGRWVLSDRRRSVTECARRWASSTGAGMAFRSDPGYLEVRYEDLVGDPTAALTALLRFLGEPVDDAVIAATRAGAATGAWAGDDGDEPEDGGVPAARPDAAGAITTTSVGRWRHDLTPAEVDEVLAVAGDRLHELGYLAG